MATGDLFGEPVIAGFALGADIVTPEEESALIAYIDAAGLSPFQFQQWTGKRLTRSFGWSYDFASGRFEPADPIPEWIAPLRVRAARFAGLAPADLAQVLLIRYDRGATIGWHRDRPVFDEVIGISLGASATMRFRRRAGTRFERANVPLEPRSIYHLSGEVRRDWEHSIAALDETRWSITFRSLAAE